MSKELNAALAAMGLKSKKSPDSRNCQVFGNYVSNAAAAIEGTQRLLAFAGDPGRVGYNARVEQALEAMNQADPRQDHTRIKWIMEALAVAEATMGTTRKLRWHDLRRPACWTRMTAGSPLTKQRDDVTGHWEKPANVTAAIQGQTVPEEMSKLTETNAVAAFATTGRTTSDHVAR